MLRLAVSKEEAEKQIQAQISRGGQLRNDLMLSAEFMDTLNACVRWSKYNETLLVKIFSKYIHDYVCFDPREHSVFDYIIDDPREGVVRMEASVNSLEGICERLELYDEPSQPKNTTQHSFGNDVFIVHGRDDGAKDSVARVVREDLKLEPIILQEQPDKGDTVIEKLERCSSNVGYAIALVTSDDIGALKDKEDDELNARARQNVVFELGYFMGKLCRERVCLLLKDKVELPSDIGGIVYIYMDPNDGWKAKLQRNIRAVIQDMPDG